MRIEDSIYLDFSDVLLKPKRTTLSSRSDVSLIRKFKFKWSPKEVELIPICAANMDTIGTVENSKILASQKMLTCMHKFISDSDVAEMKRWEVFNPGYLGYIALTSGSTKESYNRLKTLLDELPQVNFICLDVANGHMESFIRFVESVRKDYPEHIIITGNASVPEVAEELILKGADIVKAGTGGGSGCLTRAVTGVGVPQLSMVFETADFVHSLDGHLMSDGACKEVGDISKALCAGADFVMLGGMFSAYGDISSTVKKDGKLYKEFYGMSSKRANEQYGTKVSDLKASEGRELLVPYKGPLIHRLEEIQGGLRSTCTYIGAKTIKQMPKCATFIRVNNQLNKSLEKYET